MPLRTKENLRRVGANAYQNPNAYQQAKITRRTPAIKIPAAPNYKLADIKRIRASTQYSQSLFAWLLNVSVKTVQSWESGLREPAGSALRLLQIIDVRGMQPVLDAINASAHVVGRRSR